MDKMEWTTAERDAWPYWRLHHPHPRGQRTMEALSLQSQGLAPEASRRLCALATPPVSRDLHASRAGGIAHLQEVPWHRRQHQWVAYRTRIEAAWRQRPPARVAEAAARRAALTGRQRGPTQGRKCFKA